MTRVSHLVWLACGLSLAFNAHPEESSPHQLLDRMNEAVRQLDYEGRFVVQVGDRMDAIYIVHRVDGGAEKERVVSLTGKPREIIRSDEAVACLVSGRVRTLNVGRSANGRSFSPLSGVSGEQLDRFYRMQLLPPGRVAGRDAHQLLIEPRDDMRFGYRLFLDQASYLPLRSVMFDEAQKTASQMMFVELRVDQQITPIERDISAMQVAKATPSDDVPPERLTPPAWVFADLPPGFQLNVHRRRMLGGDAGELEHFIFSDGLATVSVYVQPAAEDGAASLPPSRLGAAGAVSRLIADHEVIVVGEVPSKTLDWFARNIQAASR
jgi:sigma-E factor negative regulatory protein RseB